MCVNKGACQVQEREGFEEGSDGLGALQNEDQTMKSFLGEPKTLRVYLDHSSTCTRL